MSSLSDDVMFQYRLAIGWEDSEHPSEGSVVFTDLNKFDICTWTERLVDIYSFCSLSNEIVDLTITW